MKKHLLSFLKKNIWEENCIFQSKFNVVLETMIILLFGLNFFSIPSFSFIGSGRFVTWAFTIILVLLILLDLFLYHAIKVDVVSFSLILFGFSAFISSLLCFFRAFKFTPILLSFLSAIIYCFCYSTKGHFKNKSLLFAAFIGTTLFLFLFMYKYKNELIHLNFTRLGDTFGDENDVALFMAFGLMLSINYGVKFSKSTIGFNIFSLVLALLFAFCGLSTGSKIFVFILVFCLFFFPFSIFGKKRWWLALLLIITSFLLFFFLINLPFLSSIKERLNSFISTLIGKSLSDGKTDELSTISRFDMFMCGMQMWLRKPMFGWGIWGFATFSGRFYGWSHNNISESLCNFGLIGTILFHFGFFTSISGFLKSNNKKENDIYFALLIFFLIAMLSVALNSQKLYATLAGVVFSKLSNTQTILEFNIRKKQFKTIFSERTLKNANN